MQTQWDDNTPIYLQVRDQTVSMILDGSLKAGDPLPSVRTAAADLQLNPLTVSKAYQQLVDEGFVEKRRGLGMFVLKGACKACRSSEREKFFQNEWPAVMERARSLNIDINKLLNETQNKKEDNS